MAHRYLLDTGLIIRHLRGHKPTVQLVRGLGKTSRLCVATVTRLEVHAGMLPSERYATQKLLSRFVSFSLDPRIADLAGEYIYRGRTAGRPIHVPDAIIAATATTHGLTLVSLNASDFAHITGLNIYPL